MVLIFVKIRIDFENDEEYIRGSYDDNHAHLFTDFHCMKNELI